MYRENLTERDIPYEILEKHGLTHEMIDDLPQSPSWRVHTSSSYYDEDGYGRMAVPFAYFTDNYQ